jgi:hypothetical protein
MSRLNFFSSLLLVSASISCSKVPAKASLTGDSKVDQEPLKASKEGSPIVFICSESNAYAKPSGPELARFSLNQVGKVADFSTWYQKEKKITLAKSTLTFARNKQFINGIEGPTMELQKAGESISLSFDLKTTGDELDGDKSIFEASLRLDATVDGAEAVSTLIPSYLGKLVVTKDENKSMIRTVVCVRQ